MAASQSRFTPETYEQMSNFAARLPREGDFLKRVFAGKAKSALDCGCGPGHHAAMMADWGLDVLGIDASPEMIERAAELSASRPNLRFRRLRFEHLDRVRERFDAVICMGNSLLLAGEKKNVAAVIRQMAGRLNPGGKMVLHILNLHEYAVNELSVRSTHLVEAEGRTWLFVKTMERQEDHAHMRILWIDPEAKKPGRCGSDRVFPVLDRAWFMRALADAGLRKGKFFGSFQGDPYKTRTSPNMIVSAEKA